MSLSLIFIIVLVIVVAIFDVWIIAKKGKPASLSAEVIRISKAMPLVTLLFGILFWSMRTDDIYADVECKTKVIK